MSGWLWPNGSTTKPNITDDYGWGIDPKTGLRRFHFGDDMNRFTYNCAAADGTVVYVGDRGDGGGYQVEVDHGFVPDVGWVRSRYKHNVAGSALVKVGDQVKVGQQLARQGASGYVTGVHLHFEVLINGARVNPSAFLAPRVGTTAGSGSGGGVISSRKEPPMYVLLQVIDQGLIMVQGADGRREGVQSAPHLEALVRHRDAMVKGETMPVYTGDLTGGRGAIDWYLGRVNGPQDAATLAKLEALRLDIAEIDTEFDGQAHVFTDEELAKIGAGAGAAVAASLDDVLGPLADQIASIVDEDGADQAMRERIVKLLEGGLTGTVVLAPSIG